MMSTVGARIKTARKALKLTQTELADKLGTDPSSISRWENDQQGITFENAAALASALEVTVQYLLTGEDVIPLGAGSPSRMLNVVGEVQAGVWREASEWEGDDQYPIAVIVPPQYRDLVMSAYVVKGSSMNVYYPSGSHVVVASTIANGLTPRHGNKVLVSRVNKDGQYEATLKEYVVDVTGNVWLWPRSNDPRYQDPIQYRDENTEEVTITGIVVFSQITESIF